MGAIKGAKEFKEWQEGKPLTKSRALKAHCFMCNGFEEGAEDCMGAKNCVLYPFFHYKGKKRQITPNKLRKLNLEAQNDSFMADRSATDEVSQ